MSEKRYTFKCNENNCSIFENGVWLKIEEVVDTLNEQQATINELKKEIRRLKCMNNQLERRLDYSIAYDMGECE